MVSLEALKASTVKIAGRDVLATWKLMVALVLTPMMYTFYSVLAAVLVPLRYPSLSRGFVYLIMWIILPVVAYAAIRFGENGADVYRYEA
jgi:glycerol-3-phosphate O-acyltransferase/dihydroxyacetone phosphate acyltransferase